MVTKALPAGDNATIRSVYAAVGPQFLMRLLLPLRSGSSSQPPLTRETAQKQTAMASVGLAVLSSVVRVADLAASSEMIECLPLFLSVVRASGITPLISKHTSESLMRDDGLDSAALHDALECAVAVAASGPEGLRVAEESGALGAAAAALQHYASHQQKEDEEGSAGSNGSGEKEAVRLAALMLSTPDRGRVVKDNTTAVLELLPHLARLFALPSLPAVQRSAAHTRQSATQLHLEALHALLLLLPVPLPGGEVVQESLVQRAHTMPWLRDLRSGIDIVLRSKAGAVQRHSALQLAAAATGIAGSAWLCAENERFYQMLVEVSKVETSVLLHDALAPAVSVPLESAPGVAAAQWTAPQPKSRRGSDSEAEETSQLDGLDEQKKYKSGEDQFDRSDTVLAGVGGPSGPAAPDLAGLEAVLGSNAEQAALEARMRQGRPPAPGDVATLVEGVEVPSHMAWEGPSETAGGRALRSLPACFLLLEAEIEALAEHSGEADDAASREDSTAPVLSDSVASRAFKSLEEAVEVLLQYLEQTLGQECSAAPMSEGPHDSTLLLTLGAVRVVGRFCTEAPAAFGSRVRALLPSLLSVGSNIPDEDEATAVPFLLPLLLQATAETLASPEDVSEGRQWLEAVTQPGVLTQLVHYTADAATTASTSVTEAAHASAGDALSMACKVLTQILRKVTNAATAECEDAELLSSVADAMCPLVLPLADAVLSPPVACAEDATTEDTLLQAAMVAAGAGLLAGVLTAVMADDARDRAQAQQERGEGIGMEWDRWGMGSLSPDEVEHACMAVAKALKLVHNTLHSTSVLEGGHIGLGSLCEEVEEDFEWLVCTSQDLVTGCQLFALAVQDVWTGSEIDAGEIDVDSLVRALAAMRSE